MAKMKTHRGSAKRFKRTGSGLLKRYKAYKSHKTGKKSPKRVRNLRKGTLVSKGDQRRIDSMIP
ncbi:MULTISPECIES: 50S ribosomal protein L35 [Tissierella]|uniref:Large ribosomal subunit protein bL35 n=1 Tax=Tissierella praeacuta DSM 18095 TaxID=1123404 RepID=A0A1M4Z3A5_9FIRM|nr:MULTISPECIES: 50S ribosomal protein L35 [Tissierella]MBU5257387.1 50S ribosomal protein L35 [Tissierella praeacuta]TCU67474.1 large subunit ribosomal protein L35 [Tissierella praeacuta]SHF12445.1 large subunit ribosomal protein L35 [Tissierella praeacuta DSM 18095]SUP00630.1 Ribosomal protein A [Tissierella praeacuta]HAE91447.1 50S ribosomal protein L35 [Tissierella sp.]